MMLTRLVGMARPLLNATPSSSAAVLLVSTNSEILTADASLTKVGAFVSRRSYAPKPYFWDPKNYGKTTTSDPEGFSIAGEVKPENPGARWGMYERPVDFSDNIQHTTIVTLDDDRVEPLVAETTWIEPSATIVGQVEIRDATTVWENAVIRGDVSFIRIGSASSIGANTVIDEAFEPLGPDHDGSTIIGHDVVVEANCHIRAATIHDSVLVGEGSIVLDGATIKSGSILEPGSVLQPFVTVPSGEVWAGNPARFVRELEEDEEEKRIVARARALEDQGTRRIRSYYYPKLLPLWEKFFKSDDEHLAEAEALKRAPVPSASHDAHSSHNH